MIEAGDTFFLNGHLWVIISDPAQDDQQVLCVKFNTWKRYLDQACILDVGDHPFIRHPTCVNYQDAILVPEVNILTLRDTGNLVFHGPASPHLLAKIWAAADESRLPQDYLALLVHQGFV